MNKIAYKLLAGIAYCRGFYWKWRKNGNRMPKGGCGVAASLPHKGEAYTMYASHGWIPYSYIKWSDGYYSRSFKVKDKK